MNRIFKLRNDIVNDNLETLRYTIIIINQRIIIQLYNYTTIE